MQSQGLVFPSPALPSDKKIDRNNFRGIPPGVPTTFCHVLPLDKFSCSFVARTSEILRRAVENLEPEMAGEMGYLKLKCACEFAQLMKSVNYFK